MSEPVNARRAAIVAGLLVALQVIVVFLVRPVPDAAVALVGGPHGGVDRVGGLRVHYAPPGGSEQVVELPAIAEDEAADLIEVLRGGGLQFRETLEDDQPGQLAPFATGDVTFEIDQWRPDDGVSCCIRSRTPRPSSACSPRRASPATSTEATSAR